MERTALVFGLISLTLILFSCSSSEVIESGENAGDVATVVASRQGSPTTIPLVSASATPDLLETPTEINTSTPISESNGQLFNGDRAFDYLLDQMSFGPRWPGSPGHVEVGDYIVSELEKLGWSVEEQLFEIQGIEGRNIIGRMNEGKGEVIIVGAHYDTRKIADRSPSTDLPVPGAVDGASGVAVLLELAGSLDLDKVDREIWLVFFDLEDNGSGGIPGYDWIIGSTYMAENLSIVPEAMVLVDMVGDADQQLYFEGNSDAELQGQLWAIAAELGFADQFIPELKYTMLDDHVPFARAGIPAVDIIDFDYPYYHTVEDTADKANKESLMRVGRTIEVWLEERLNDQEPVQ